LKTLATTALLVAFYLGGCAVAQTTAKEAPAAVNEPPAAAKEVPAAPAEEPAPKFDSAFMNSAENIKVGQAIWNAQCIHCHGAKAYPGKAPKLKPGGMDADFIYDRVTYGFKAMPPWKGVFTLEERKSVVAWIKSDSFAP
jgi:mono/diheme cytochrome c family protein